MEIRERLQAEMQAYIAEQLAAWDAKREAIDGGSYELQIQQILADFIDFYRIEYEQLDLYGKPEVIEVDARQEAVYIPHLLNAAPNGQVKVVKISYPIRLQCKSPALLDIIGQSAAELEVTAEHMIAYLPVGDTPIDQLDFEPAVAATKRFNHTVGQLKEDVDTLLQEATRSFLEVLVTR
ncbi:hypothetical protein [Sphingobacterium suaedae]|uniref:DUF2589 domain-containing protein n=1 Tax=Sphingobacterium suaedae TaxID=1686402 RepID=A0ABW5KG23_9SPHI